MRPARPSWGDGRSAPRSGAANATSAWRSPATEPGGGALRMIASADATPTSARCTDAIMTPPLRGQSDPRVVEAANPTNLEAPPTTLRGRSGVGVVDEREHVDELDRRGDAVQAGDALNQRVREKRA